MTAMKTEILPLLHAFQTSGKLNPKCVFRGKTLLGTEASLSSVIPEPSYYCVYTALKSHSKNEVPMHKAGLHLSGQFSPMYAQWS